MKQRLLFILATAFSSFGCGEAIKDFVQGGARQAPVISGPPSLSLESPRAIKVSPGAVSAAGSQVQGRLTVTPSKAALQGSQVDARLSLSQNRVE